MVELDFGDWLKILPPAVGIFTVLIAFMAFPGNTGMLGIAIFFAIISSFTPYTGYRYYHNKKIRSLEDQFPEFLRDMLYEIKRGMTIPQAIDEVSKNDYGRLTDEIRKMRNQISLGMPFDEVIMQFGRRMGDSKLIRRSLEIVAKSERFGGDSVSAIETVVSDIAKLKRMERERSSKIHEYTTLTYLSYTVFTGITVVLYKVLMMISSSSVSPGGSLCIPLKSKLGHEKIICSLFVGISDFFRLGSGIPGYYKSLFMSVILIMGVFFGLTIGQVSENSPAKGLKHSVILTGVGIAIFLLCVNMGII